MKKIIIHPIAKYNLDKPINGNQGRAPERTSDSGLKKALEERIEKEPPLRLMHSNAEPRVYKTFFPTEIQKRMVWQMAAMGASQHIIRLAVLDNDKQPVREDLLMAHFGDLMRHAREQANFTVALKIYELAIGRDAEYDMEGNLIRPSAPPNMDALKWWDRTRGEGRRLMLEARQPREVDTGGGVTLVIEGS